MWSVTTLVLVKKVSFWLTFRMPETSGYLDTHQNESFKVSARNQHKESLCLHADKLINHKRSLDTFKAMWRTIAHHLWCKRASVLFSKTLTVWHHCLGRFHGLAWALASQAMKLVLGRTWRTDRSLLSKLMWLKSPLPHWVFFSRAMIFSCFWNVRCFWIPMRLLACLLTLPLSGAVLCYHPCVHLYTHMPPELW